MPRYEVEYEYTTINYGVVEVEAEDEDRAADMAFEEAELPWDYDSFEISRVDEV